MGRMISNEEFLKFITSDMLPHAVAAARHQPVMSERKSGCIVAMFRPYTGLGNFWRTGRWTQAPYGIGLWQQPIFGDDLCIINSAGEFGSTLGIAMAKITSCEQAVLRGKGAYSGIGDKDLPTDPRNGFTHYPGACCYTICDPETTEKLSMKTGSYERDMTGVMADLVLAGSGGTGAEDLTAVVSVGVKVMNFFGHFGYTIKPLGEPPIKLPDETIII